MNGPRGAVLIAVLLLISGYLGGSPIFGLMGVAGFVFAIAVLIGEAISQFRQGFNEPRQEKPRERAQRAADPAKRRPASRS